MGTRRRGFLLAALTALVAAACAPAAPPASSGRAARSVSDMLAAGSIEGFERALAPRPFTFPEDHIVTFEASYGLAPNYRKSIERGLAGLTEHA